MIRRRVVSLYHHHRQLSIVIAGPHSCSTTLFHYDAFNNRPTTPNHLESKYQAKLLARAKTLGFDSVDDMMTAYRLTAATSTLKPTSNQPINDTKSGHQLLPSHVKPLNQILHMDKLIDKPYEFIEKLWITHHLNKPITSAVIPSEVYNTLHQNAMQYPSFVLPVFTDTNNMAETYILQHSGHQTHFTNLLAYQTHQENAPVLFTLTFYTDMQVSKGLVLLLGSGVCPLPVQKQLTESMRDFYTSSAVALVKQFHTNPRSFQFMHVMDLVKATHAWSSN